MKTKKNNFHLLTISVFLHLMTSFCAFYLDSYTWPNGYKEINYWLNYFSWWCVQVSLITIIYFIYRWFKKSPRSYFDKVFELVVINANIIAIGLFTVSMLPITWGAKPCTAAPQKPGPINIFFFSMDRRVFWWIYAIIWHYLAPILVITYFVRRKISLANTYYQRKSLFFYSFLHPLFYLILVLLRPLVPGSERYPCGRSKYPYFFLDWIGGDKYSGLWWGLVTISTILFFLFVFWLSTLLFWWYSGHKLKAKLRSDLAKKNSKTNDTN